MPEKALDGKVVIVTGAGSGIGAAVAKQAAEDGARVALIGRTPSSLGETSQAITGAGGEALSIRGDITQQEDIDAAISRVLAEWGTVDGLVNNAGMFIFGHTLEHSREDWQKVIDLDLSAAFFMSQAAGRVMARSGKGAIVNMASIDGHGAEGLVPSYSACKAGIMGLTRSMAIDLTPLGIRCNSVSPGYVAETAMAEDTTDGSQPLSEVLRDWGRAPLERMVTVGEVADCCSYLLSDRATGVTGADLLVDGGLLSNVYALESEEGTGWAKIRAEALAEVRRKLDSGEL